MNEFGLILCEMCGRIQDEENTESYKEPHGPGHLETLSRTTCCKASYTTVEGQDIIAELVRIRDASIPDPQRVRSQNVTLILLDQIYRDNIDAIIPHIETAFDL